MESTSSHIPIGHFVTAWKDHIQNKLQELKKKIVELREEIVQIEDGNEQQFDEITELSRNLSADTARDASSFPKPSKQRKILQEEEKVLKQLRKIHNRYGLKGVPINIKSLDCSGFQKKVVVECSKCRKNIRLPMTLSTRIIKTHVYSIHLRNKHASTSNLKKRFRLQLQATHEKLGWSDQPIEIQIVEKSLNGKPRNVLAMICPRCGKAFVIQAGSSGYSLIKNYIRHVKCGHSDLIKY